MSTHEPLHNPVFQRMKTDNRETPAGCENFKCRIESCGNFFEFVIDGDPDRLERSRCNVLVRITPGCCCLDNR